MVHDVVVEAKVETLGERRLQIRVTSGLVQRVGIIVDHEQLSHGRLAGATTILELEATLLCGTPAEVGCRAPVDDIDGRVNALSQIVLLIL